MCHRSRDSKNLLKLWFNERRPLARHRPPPLHPLTVSVLAVRWKRSRRHRTAILCSLVQTCKHLHIHPFVYLRDVIERVSTHPARLVLELTPREWKRLRRDSGAHAAA